MNKSKIIFIIFTILFITLTLTTIVRYANAVDPISTTTTTALSSSTITFGGSVTDTATVTPAGTGLVIFQASTNNGTTFVNFSSENLTSGSATSAPYTPASSGIIYLRAVYGGDSRYAGSISGNTSEPLTVNKAATTTTTALSSSTITFGGSVTDTATVTPGGTGVVFFQVSIDNGTTFVNFSSENLTIGSATSAQYTPTSARTFYFRAVYRGDSRYAGSISGNTSEPLVTHLSTAISVTVSPAAASIDAGASKSYTATATDQYGNSWNVTSSTSWSISSGAGGSWSGNAYISANAGNWTVTANYSGVHGTAHLIVNPALIAPSPSPSPGTVDQSQTSSLTISAVTTGTSPYTYQWYSEVPSGSSYSLISGATSASYTFVTSSLTPSGAWLFKVQVTDSTGASVNSTSASVIVDSALVAPTVSASLGSVDQGQTSSLTISAVTTGTSPYTYQWYSEVPSGSSYSLISGATSANYNFTTSDSTTTGTWSFEIQVTDTTGASINSTAASVTVSALNNVTFTESGLPSGTSWSVTFNGTTLSTTATNITFTDVTLGNYSWNASMLILGGTGTRYVASTSSGTMDVPAQASQTITYTTQYQVTFAVTPSGSGSTSPAGSNVWENAGTLSITATSGAGYSFSSWSSDTGSITFVNANSASTTATISGTGTITAQATLPSPTSTPTPTASPKPSPTPTPKPTTTPTPTATQSPTPTSSPTASPKHTQSSLAQDVIYVIVAAVVIVAIVAVVLVLRKRMKDKS